MEKIFNYQGIEFKGVGTFNLTKKEEKINSDDFLSSYNKWFKEYLFCNESCFICEKYNYKDFYRKAKELE